MGLISEALSTRPDLAQAALQVQSGEIALKASRNAALPEVDLIGNFQTRGSTEVPFATLGTPGSGIDHRSTRIWALRACAHREFIRPAYS